MGETTLAAFGPSTTRRAQWVIVGMLVTLLAVIGLSAWAQPAPPPASGRDEPWAMHDGGRHGGMHHGGGMGGMMFSGSPERIGHMVDFMLDGLHPSEAQRSQIKQIAMQAAGDLKAQMTQGKALRQRGLDVFTAPTVDPAAAEQVRQQMMQQHDQTSHRVMQAMLDVARVLTPEQRATIGQRLRDRQARMEDRMLRMQQMRPPR